jgi:hypothetical protein
MLPRQPTEARRKGSTRTSRTRTANSARCRPTVGGDQRAVGREAMPLNHLSRLAGNALGCRRRHARHGRMQDASQLAVVFVAAQSRGSRGRMSVVRGEGRRDKIRDPPNHTAHVRILADHRVRWSTAGGWGATHYGLLGNWREIWRRPGRLGRQQRQRGERACWIRGRTCWIWGRLCRLRWRTRRLRRRLHVHCRSGSLRRQGQRLRRLDRRGGGVQGLRAVSARSVPELRPVLRRVPDLSSGRHLE